uniref:Uncharacterized protein n=1 Tax=Romanomermis culicivorax TaxID=13658 RepID=A0A915IDS7_ROMCU
MNFSFLKKETLVSR